MEEAVYVLITYPDGQSEEWFLSDPSEVQAITERLGEPDNVTRS